MALFNKYFGQKNKDSFKEESFPNEDLTGYINAVNHIIKNAFNLEECGESFSTYHDEFSEIYGEKNERILLLKYESRIICLIILGYYFLRDLNFADKCNGSIISLLEKCNIFRSVVMRYAQGITNIHGEVYWAIFRKVKSQTPNISNTEIAYFYINHRFKRYSTFIINGLDEFLEKPEGNTTHPFNHAYFYYINPQNDFPIESYTDRNERERSIFHRSINYGYKELKKILNHE